jgi:hypothetical protein
MAQRIKLVSRVSLSTFRKRTTPNTPNRPKATIRLLAIATIIMETRSGSTARAPTNVRE